MLIVLNLLSPDLVFLISYVTEGLAISATLSADLILNVIVLLFIVYFGYFILVDVKYFLDSLSARFVRQDSGKLQNVTYDVAILISLVLASALATPILSSIQGVGGTIAKVVNIILLAVGFVIVYHLANQIYSIGKQRFEKLVRESRQFKTNNLLMRKTKDESA